MKTKFVVPVIAAAIAGLSFVAPYAYAVMYFLEDCKYTYVMEYQKHIYVGTYKSQYGNYFTANFDSYCPSTLNR